MANRMVFISGKMVKGGSERVMSILANHFINSRDVKIITLLSDSVEYGLDERIEVECFSREDRLRFVKFPGWVFRLVKEFRQLDGNDAVISFVARINIVALLANIFTHVPVIVSERNDPERDGRGPCVKIMTRLLYPKARRVVFQSEYAKSLFSEKVKEIGEVIPNPVGPFNVKWEEARDKTFVNVGRLSKQKNQQTLIRAFGEVVKVHPDAGLYIYGEGPLKGELEKLCSELGVSNRVFFMGVSENIHERIVKRRAFVLSSDYEGQSNALLEAMALGMPCITTDIPGHRGIVNKDNAVIVQIGDIQGLVNAMLAIIEENGLGPGIGLEAAKSLADMDRGRILGKWEKLLEESTHG